MNALVHELLIKYRFALWPVAVGVSSIIIIAFVIIPQVLTYIETKNQITTIKERFNLLEVKAQALQSPASAINSQDIQMALTLLPTDPDIPQAVAVLQNQVATTGLTMKNVSYISSRQPAGGNSFEVDIVVAGSLQQIRNLLISLQEAPRIYQVEAITVQRTTAGVEVEIPLAVFFQQLPNKIGGIDDPAPVLTEAEKKLLAQISTYLPKASQVGSQPSQSTQSADPSKVPLGKSDPFQ